MSKKYEIVWCESKDGVSKTGKPYTMTKMTLKGEDGVTVENVSTFDAVQNGGTIVGEIVQKGQYLNFETEKTDGRKPNMDRVMEKKAGQIAEAQGRKEESIGKAQDRSAMMWAKYGATELVAHHPAFKDLNEVEVMTKVSRLANQIYHDALEPF